MKLEVGMYVRFKDKRGNTYIRKIINIPEDNRYASIYIDKEANYTTHLSFRNVLKASHNIIDLIEVGDYVNGYYVEDIGKTFVNVSTGSNYFQNPTIYEDDIKSIVTKEMFSSMEYKVGE